MAYREKIIEKLEFVLLYEEEKNRLLRRQDIFLLLHPSLGENNTFEIRKEIASLIEDSEKEEKDLRDLLSFIKRDERYVY